MSNRRTKAQRRAGKAPAAGKRAGPPPSGKNGRTGRTGPPTRVRRNGRAKDIRALRRQPTALTRLQRRSAEAFSSALQAGLTASARVPKPLTPLVRPDLIWAAATALISAIVFATIIQSHSALGDGPESVSGIESLGILHAPGYPAYVLVGRLFTLLIPFGSAAFKVNLFSLVCAALTVGGVVLLARRLGAARWAAALAGLCLATGVGFWFYATFAKHPMFSGLLFLITLYGAIEYRARPSTRWLVITAAAFALGLGSSWPLEILIAPALAFVLVRSWRQLSIRSFASATATGALILVVVYGFVLVRAQSNPTMNFDRVTNLHALSNLVGRADFTPQPTKARAGGPTSGGGSSGASSPSPQSAPQNTPGVTPGVGSQFGGGAAPAGAVQLNSRLPQKLRAQGKMFTRELSVIGLLLAAWGVVALLLSRLNVASYPLLIAFVVSSLGAATAAGVSDATTVHSNMIEEGFILGAVIVLALWLAVGATDFVTRVGALARSRLGTDALLARVRDRRAATVLRSSPIALLAAVVLIPQLLGNWPNEQRSAQPYADRFATTVLNQLPRNAVVVFNVEELTYPAVYRQIVFHQRRDVIVLDLYSLAYTWYRKNLEHRLHETLPPRIGDSILDARRDLKWLAQQRPVFMDATAAQTLAGINPYARQVQGDYIGYRQVGLLAQLTGGVGPALVSSPASVDQAFRSAERTAGLQSAKWDEWPNSLTSSTVYTTAALEVARGYYQHRDYAGLRSALTNALALDPSNFTARATLQKLGG